MKLLYTLIILSTFFISCSKDSILNPTLEDTPACEWWEFWCNSEPIESEDCAGIAGGNAELDNCGVCDSDSSNDCTQDDCGIWGGNYEVEYNTLWIAPSIDGAYSLNYKGDLEN